MSSDQNKRDPFQEYIGGMEGMGPQTTLFALLTQAGIPLPNPDDVPDSEMTAVLWRVIRGMADEGVILDSTNHLSDRELYSLLWTDLLLEQHPVTAEDFAARTHLDVLGGWSNDDIEAYLRYYADEESRKNWIEEFHESIPGHVDPPYDRDRLLPGH